MLPPTYCKCLGNTENHMQKESLSGVMTRIFYDGTEYNAFLFFLSRQKCTETFFYWAIVLVNVTAQLMTLSAYGPSKRINLS